jgi:enoyl-CoA hydratase/carnithine racemase
MIAAVQGYALGLGAAIAVMCDIVIASADTHFGFPEARFGIQPTFTAIALMRIADDKFARWLLLSGVLVDAERAHVGGMITRDVPPGDFEKELEGTINSVLAASPSAIGLVNVLLVEVEREREELEAALRHASRISIEGLKTADAEEGRHARAQKRDPSWISRED